MSNMNKIKTGAGTKVFIDGSEVLQVQSLELSILPDAIQSAKIELPIESVSTDEDGNITFNLIGKL